MRLEKMLYLLPITLLVGTNIPLLDIGARVLSVGTTELVLGLLVGGLWLRRWRGAEFAPLPKNLLWSAAFFSLMLPFSLLANIFVTGDLPVATAWVEVVRWYEYLPILPMMFWLVKSDRQAHNLMRIAGFFALLNVVVALYQAATFNVSDSRVYGLFITAANREGTSISNPNVIGAVFMGAALFFLAFALTQKGRGRAWNLFFMVISIVAMTLSLSRSAMIGFLVGVVALSFFYRAERKLFLAIGLSGLLTLGATVLVSDTVLMRLINTVQMTSGTVDATGISDRAVAWQYLFWKGLYSPIFGTGYADIYRRSDYLYITADNYYVEIFFSTGLLGLFALGWLFWNVSAPVARARIAPHTFAYTLKCGYLACFFAFLVDNITGGQLMDPRLMGLFWMLAGLTIQAMQRNQKTVSD